MIRINLLKEVSRKKKAEFRIPPKAVILGGSGLGLVLVVGLVVLFIRSRPQTDAGDEELTISEHTPSSFTRSAIVEEVVQDIHDTRDKLQRSGHLNLPYEQLSFAEKVNFEVLYGKNVCDLLIKTVPEQIGLRSLDAENFQTVYAVGLSSSKDLVDRMFIDLKSENIILLPKPLTFIRPNQGGGFRFAFSCRPTWGLNLADPIVDLSLSNLPLRSTLKSTVKKFESIASKSNVSIGSSLSRIGGQKIDKYRRFTYEFNGTSSFTDFVQFLENLHDARIFCAFKRISIVAKSRKVINIDAEVIFTTRG